MRGRNGEIERFSQEWSLQFETTASAYERGLEEEDGTGSSSWLLAEDTGVGIFYQKITNITMSASSYFMRSWICSWWCGSWIIMDWFRQLNDHGFDVAVEEQGTIIKIHSQ